MSGSGEINQQLLKPTLHVLTIALDDSKLAKM